ncbi:MAG: hypothetical protein FIA90_03740 [candidate division NC10 bacterium]|nr:hypothetical protein [candidate division NC10 bacterium]
MMTQRPPQITQDHLGRPAATYIRVSTGPQARDSTGSIAHQRDQQAYAFHWGWGADQVEAYEDLGQSGTRTDGRVAFQRLLTRVAAGHVGAVFCANTARLTRAPRDFETLVALCRLHRTLLVVEGNVLDLNDPASRLLARLQAGVAAYENDLRTRTLVASKYAKARLGHAVSRPPGGFVVSTKGQWVKAPDHAVQQAIEQVLGLFRQLGSVPQVLRALVRAKAMLPVRTSAGELRWVRPCMARLHMMLRHPAYAGYYTLGRRQVIPGDPDGRVRWTPQSEWIMVPHHEGYITPAEWRANQERLRGNRVPTTQPVGRGTALCHGLLWCGRCNRPMYTRLRNLVRGNEEIRYACLAAYQQHGEPRCWSIDGRTLDRAMAAALLGRLQPADFTAVLAAGRELNQQYEAACRRRAQELEDADDAVNLAKRRYTCVDPANRRLAATLERHYEQALQRREEIELRHREEGLSPPLTLTPEEVSAICREAQDLPGLWSAPTTTPQDRRELLRLFVQRIRLVAVSARDVTVEIAWVGGATSTHCVARPKKGALVALELRTQGWRPAAIAAELNRRGFIRSCGKPFTARDVHHYCWQAAHRARKRGGKRPRGDGTEDNAMLAEW